MQNLQQALALLKIEFSANWDEICTEIQLIENPSQDQKNASQNLKVIYNYPNNPDVSRKLEATPKEMRQKFLNNIGETYLRVLAQTIPYLGCGNLWAELTKMGIDITYSKEAVIHKGQYVYGKAAAFREAYLPENLNSEIIKAPSMWLLRYAANALSSSISSWWNNTPEIEAKAEAPVDNSLQPLEIKAVLTSTAQVAKLLEVDLEPLPESIDNHIGNNIASTPPNTPIKPAADIEDQPFFTPPSL